MNGIAITVKKNSMVQHSLLWCFYKIGFLVTIFTTSCISNPKITDPQINNESNIMVIIIHENNKIENLTLKELELIYLGKVLYWSNGLPIIRMAFPKKTNERESFSQIVLQKSSSQMVKYWVQSRELGRPIYPPIVIATGRRMMNFIQSREGGIGYVRLSDYKLFKQKRKYKVKMIKINGISPSLEEVNNKKYPLWCPQHLLAKKTGNKK